jgi:hypothetical protein
MRFIIRRKGAALAFALLLVASTGCSVGHSHSDYLPAEDKARQALETTLTAWQNGQKIGRIDAVSPPIEPVDNKWQAGQKLQGYEILQAETPDEGPSRFLVRLTMKTPPGKQEVRYVVVGIDPLWVYREEDYRKVSGM